MPERYTVLNRNNYPAGLHTFGPVDIPLGVRRVFSARRRSASPSVAAPIPCHNRRYGVLGHGPSQETDS